MKSRGFRRPVLERVRAPLIGMKERRGVVAQVGDEVRAQPKEAPVRCEAYLRAVASLPCWRCGVVGHSQAAHADEGKGMAIKSSDTTAMPLCGPHDGLPGCHHIAGSSGQYTRETRRTLEKQAAQDTRTTLVLKSMSDPKLRALLVKLGVTA